MIAKQSAVLIFLLTLFITLSGCELFGIDQSGDLTEQSAPMTFGNSDNVRIIANPIMMFHEVIVSDTDNGAELAGKIHVKGHKHYVPGHVDIVAINNSTGEVVGVVSTDFNHRIAKMGHRNLNHGKNIEVRMPGVDMSKVTIHVAYHHSNDMRLSEKDCGANVALASLQNDNSVN